MFENITYENLKAGANQLEKVGIKKDVIDRHIKYWVKFEDGREFPYKELVREAHIDAIGVGLKFTSTEGNRNEFFRKFRKLKKVEHRVGINFFEKKELKFFQSKAGDNYNERELESKVVRNKIYPIFRKTKIWATEVDSRLPNYVKKGSATWLNWNRFRSYSWFKILNPELNEDNVFFTVGVDSGNSENVPLSLVIKIDCQWENVTGRKLPEDITDKFRSLLKERIPEREERFFTIELDELDDYDWEELITKTVKYIEKYESVYEAAVKLVQGERGNEKRVARICWNDKGWVEPSGKVGKSNNKDLHEYIHGFGYEEWLFDYSREIEGYQFGFLEPIRQGHNAYAGKKLDIWLYTIDSRSGKRFWVGWIRDLYVLTEKEAKEVERTLLTTERKEEARRQVTSVNGIPGDRGKWKDVNIVNVKFKRENAIINDPVIELSKNHTVKNSSYYSFKGYSSDYEVQEIETNEKELKHKNGKQKNPKPRKRKSHSRTSREVELTYTHDKIRYQLVNELNGEYGWENVFPEESAGYGKNIVDVIVKDKNQCIYYEIKTQNTVKGSIREALGQIIEYSYWNTAERAKKLFIVIEPLHDLKEAQKYLEHLRNKLDLKIYLKTVDINEE